VSDKLVKIFKKIYSMLSKDKGKCPERVWNRIGFSLKVLKV